MLGKDLDVKSSFLICWTKDGKDVGGTATAIKLARKLDIPIYNLGTDTDEQIDKIYHYVPPSVMTNG